MSDIKGTFGKKLSLFFLIIVALFLSFSSNKKIVFATDNSSKIVMEINSKRVLYDHNANEKNLWLVQQKF